MRKYLLTGCAAAMLSLGAAGGASAVDLTDCYLLPNTGNYVRYGQIDCYTGQHVSVAGNSGNNIGSAPDKRAPRTVTERLTRNIPRQAGIAHDEAHAAKAAFRARNWPAFRQHTKAAAAAVKKAVKKGRRLNRLNN